MQRKALFIVTLLCGLLALSACASGTVKKETEIEVQDFTHTNQNNEEVSLASLKGKPWLATFIFTNCNTICPPMTANMAEVQAKLEAAGAKDYEIVAFSVDPDVDTPDVLKNYIGHYGVVDESKWQLLTGYNQKYMEQFARKSFNSLVKNDPNSDQVVHMANFYLVNKDGFVIKSYDGNSDVPFDTIVADIKALEKE